MDFYIGIDGGGTKTAITAAAADASAIREAITGSASWREIGIPPVIDNIRRSVAGLLRAGDHIGGVVIGLPCYGESDRGDAALRKEAAAAFPGTGVFVTNDVEVGWAGSLALAPGINVVAGTGSIAFGRDDRGDAARAGGWDEFFSDEGSGYWLARKMLQLFSKQSDGRAPRGALYDIVREEFSLTGDMDLIDHVRREHLDRRESVAGLQVLLERAALAGDRGARDLYHKAARELCAMALAVRRRLAFAQSNFLVSYSGGVFKAGELITPPFQAALEAEGAQLAVPRCTPAQGAALLAFDRYFPQGLVALRQALGLS